MKNQRGITLIALIITIIVMLILVGVTVNVALNGGLFATAKKAASETQIAAEQETLLSAVIATMTDGKVDFEKLDNNLPNGFTGSNGKYKSEKGNKYRVYRDGEVEYSREPDEPTPIYASLEDNNDGEGTKTLVFTVEENAKEGSINLGQVDDSYWSANLPPWSANDSYRTSITKAEFRDVVKPKSSTAYWFYELNNLTDINNIENLYTSSVDSMACMFYGCTNLIGLDVRSLDTGKVTIMAQMFNGCKKLEKINTSNFDTRNVTNFNGAFDCCEKITELDVSGFDTSKVTNFGMMFYGCKNLNKLDISNFDTKNLTSMNAMFMGCNNLKELNLSNLNTDKLTNIVLTFRDCYNLRTTFTINPTNLREEYIDTDGKTKTDYDGCFSAAATETGAKITVRCKAEHKEKVEKIINEKSAKSNVVLEVIN